MKDIPGYEDFYTISECGKTIISLERMVRHSKGGLRKVQKRIMRKKEIETLAKVHGYASKIGGKQANITTPHWKYRYALKSISKILLANFGAWDKNNPHQSEDQEYIKEGFEELEEIAIALDCE